MKYLKDELVEVSVRDMELQLLRQAKKLEESTPYRIRTVELALQVLERYNSTKAFTDKDLTMYVVKLHLPEEGKDRQKDIAKMLYTQHGYRYNELNFSAEFRKLRKEAKRGARGYKVGFTKVKKLG